MSLEQAPDGYMKPSGNAPGRWPSQSEKERDETYETHKEVLAGDLKSARDVLSTSVWNEVASDSLNYSLKTSVTSSITPVSGTLLKALKQNPAFDNKKAREIMFFCLDHMQSGSRNIIDGVKPNIDLVQMQDEIEVYLDDNNNWKLRVNYDDAGAPKTRFDLFLFPEKGEAVEEDPVEEDPVEEDPVEEDPIDDYESPDEDDDEDPEDLSDDYEDPKIIGEKEEVIEDTPPVVIEEDEDEAEEVEEVEEEDEVTEIPEKTAQELIAYKALLLETGGWNLDDLSDSATSFSKNPDLELEMSDFDYDFNGTHNNERAARLEFLGLLDRKCAEEDVPPPFSLTELPSFLEKNANIEFGADDLNDASNPIVMEIEDYIQAMKSKIEGREVYARYKNDTPNGVVDSDTFSTAIAAMGPDQVTQTDYSPTDNRSENFSVYKFKIKQSVETGYSNYEDGAPIGATAVSSGDQVAIYLDYMTEEYPLITLTKENKFEIVSAYTREPEDLEISDLLRDGAGRISLLNNDYPSHEVDYFNVDEIAVDGHFDINHYDHPTSPPLLISTQPDEALAEILASTMAWDLSPSKILYFATRLKIMGPELFLKTDGEVMFDKAKAKLIESVEDKERLKGAIAHGIASIDALPEDFADATLVDHDVYSYFPKQVFTNPEYETGWNPVQKFCYRRENHIPGFSEWFRGQLVDYQAELNAE